MKNKILQIIINVTKYTTIVFGLLIMTLSTIMAEKGSAQIKSVKDVLVNVNHENATIKRVFNSIEDQTDFSFIYSNQTVDLRKQRINIDLKETTVENVLIEMAKQTGLKFRQVNKRISAIKSKNNSQGDILSIEVLADVNITGKNFIIFSCIGSVIVVGVSFCW